MLFELLFKIIFLGVLISYLTPMKYSVKKSVLIITVFHLFIWMANYLCYVYISKKLITDFLFFTIGIPGFFCFNVVAKYKGFRVLFSLLTVAILSFFSSFIGSLPFHGSLALQYGIKYGSFILIMLFVVKVFRKPYIRMLQTLEKGWGLLCLIPFCLINIISLLQYVPAPINERPENIPIVIAAFVLMFIFYAIFYFNFENISQLFQLKRDRQVLAVQTDMYNRQYDSIMDNVRAMKIYRHDMKHHLSAISTLLNAGNLPEAIKYISKLDHSLSDTVVERFCENYAVNAILSFYIQKARNAQIEVECESDIPDEIQIDSIELGLIFANSLDNAINACKLVERAEERKITIICRLHYGQIYIRISNPYTGEVKFDGEYPVSENDSHGVGTRSIAGIAQKYEGVSSFVAHNGVFSTTVTLKC